MIITFPSHICIETVHGLRQQVLVAALNRGLNATDTMPEAAMADGSVGSLASNRRPTQSGSAADDPDRA
ncbi:hypothetical protein FYK55_11200 [Roseiconus nitratireducens]|uniref:Uncharacterized protein n=1 Tax=Roseiconus nitratireducens TaxID=2605748 RepID=A0A5M6DEW5_9BACT|nr:hypothetical protein [Roseiconus nitratireducens]KAA5543745.1 hypothetical protein FYK55_11200 [Roseiconus nitratireducens]